ncbi:hypothetical protein N0B31_17720 [Salinirubellus salinus]|uniref:Uncharacterized protein n=1 Tax=Salinirubellus salinus TaxID=1364945 RepID=A0A9E7R1M8_9EURY|nr:hypothetical protein [Salinirubellus salinus]UWM53951.1 hypothetical protein N0B31_17720 [Salinirubellus salinus]
MSESESMSGLKARVSELESELEELSNELRDVRDSALQQIAQNRKRINTLENRALNSSIGIESKLSRLERMLCGIDDEPEPGTSNSRAYLIAQLFEQGGGTKTEMGHGIKMGENGLKAVIQRAERQARHRDDIQISNKQIVRAFDAFVELSDGKARRDKSKDGRNRLIILSEYYDEMVWSREQLQERINRELESASLDEE